MNTPGWYNGYADADLESLPDDGFPGAGDLDVTWPTLTLVGGMPYGGSVLAGGTYIIKRQGDEILTPEGWFHISELT